MKKNETIMRVPRSLLKEIKQIKLVERESYASVVKRLIEKERRKK